MSWRSLLQHVVLGSMTAQELKASRVSSDGSNELYMDPELMYDERRSKEESTVDGPNAFLDDAGSKFKKLMGGVFARSRPLAATTADREAPEVLQDLVKMSIAAHRSNLGNFLWYSWEGAKSKGCRSKPCHGTTLVGISVQGAKKLLEAMTSGEFKMRHIDVGLRHHMEQHATDFGSCYMYPSIGHFAVHKSGCEPSLDIRESNWKESWVQEGTRPSGHHGTGTTSRWQSRYLMKFRTKGQSLQWVRKVDLPENPLDEALFWKSWQEEESLDPTDPTAPLTSPRTESRGNPYAAASGSSRPGVPQMTRREKRSRRTEKMFNKRRLYVLDENQVG